MIPGRYFFETLAGDVWPPFPRLQTTRCFTADRAYTDVDTFAAAVALHSRLAICLPSAEDS